MRGSAASGKKLFKVSYVVFLENGEDGRQSGFFSLRGDEAVFRLGESFGSLQTSERRTSLSAQRGSAAARPDTRWRCSTPSTC